MLYVLCKLQSHIDFISRRTGSNPLYEALPAPTSVQIAEKGIALGRTRIVGCESGL